jgi:cold-inducible RNA-binding protein
MAMKLYVGGLPYSVTEQELESLFAEHGTVASATIIKDRDTGQSKGFGFVEMAEDSEAKDAMENLNGKDFGGRSIVVNEARPQVNRDDRR